MLKNMYTKKPTKTYLLPRRRRRGRLLQASPGRTGQAERDGSSWLVPGTNVAANRAKNNVCVVTCRRIYT